MEILSGCEVDGAYDFVALNLKHERVSIRDEAELFARLPMGAVGLQAKLQRRGELVVDMTIVGRKHASRQVFERRELRGRCESATHVLTGLTVGAFTLLAGASSDVGGGVAVRGAGAGARVGHSQELLAADGDPSMCARLPGDLIGTDEPPAGCGALLRVEAVPLVLTGGVAALAPIVTPAPTGVQTQSKLAVERGARRRVAAWRGTAMASGVLSAVSFGGVVGGAVMLGQYNSDNFDDFDDSEPTDADRAKRSTGTKLIIGSLAGVLGFGALAIAAGGASRRARAGLRNAKLSAAISPGFSGVTLAGRF